jgi:hypothetical protein
MVPQDLKVLQGLLVLKESQVQLARKGYKALQERPEQRELMALQDLKVLLDPRVLRVILDRQAHRVFKA